MKKVRPLSNTLIVDDNLGLREKSVEAMGNAELLSALPSVVCATRTPAIKQRSVTVQFDDME